MMLNKRLTEKQLRIFYETEVELAQKLKDAPREKRLSLYGEVYDELYRRVPFHPMLTRKTTEDGSKVEVALQMKFLSRFILPGITFLEVGSGDCALSFEVARTVGKVYGLDVSEVISFNVSPPKNFEMIISDGVSVPVSPGTVDVAYSNQLMEHLHPDDAMDQLANILTALKPGGRYVCVTPNRFDGPGDISCYFSDVAKGFHLKEYSYRELVAIFYRAGFSQVVGYFGHQRLGVYQKIPLQLIFWLEQHVESLTSGHPFSERQAIMRRLPNRLIQSVRLVGIK